MICDEFMLNEVVVELDMLLLLICTMGISFLWSCCLNWWSLC